MTVVTARRLVIAGLGLVAAAALAAPLVLPIAELLPAGEGQSTCFAANFDGSQELVSGWHREKPTPAPVTRMTVRFHHPEGEEAFRDDASGRGYDWRYTAYVGVTVKGDAAPVGAPTICEWRRHAINAIAPSLGCYIECDGGGIEIRRVPGRKAVHAVWEASSHLRMSGCGGGGVILRGGETAKTFRLEAVPQAECKPDME